MFVFFFQTFSYQIFFNGSLFFSNSFPAKDFPEAHTNLEVHTNTGFSIIQWTNSIIHCRLIEKSDGHSAAECLLLQGCDQTSFRLTHLFLRLEALFICFSFLMLHISSSNLESIMFILPHLFLNVFTPYKSFTALTSTLFLIIWPPAHNHS